MSQGISRPRFGLVVLAALATAGCSNELGPTAYPTAIVTGEVVDSGKPVGKGWVEFQPMDGAVGLVRSAPIQPDGRFRAEGVAVGMNAVRLIDLPPSVLGPVQMFRLTSPIHRDIAPNSDAPMHIDVAEEMMRYQVQRQARSAGGGGGPG